MTITPVALDEFIAQGDDAPSWRVQDLWPTGGRVLLAAQYKAGKTTLMGNLIRSLVDDQRFLDTFQVTPAKNIVLIDDELDEDMLRRWLRDQGIENTHRVNVLSLRGRVGEFAILTPEGRKPWASVLHDADVVILDCLRPVLDALGLSESTGAGKFVLAFDALMREAQVSEAAIVHHMGHDAQRARGDSRLRDWPDVEWRMTRDGTEPDAPRHFTAYGRDVDFKKSRLYYDELHRRLTLNKPVTVDDVPEPPRSIEDIHLGVKRKYDAAGAEMPYLFRTDDDEPDDYEPSRLMRFHEWLFGRWNKYCRASVDGSRTNNPLRRKRS